MGELLKNPALEQATSEAFESKIIGSPKESVAQSEQRVAERDAREILSSRQDLSDLIEQARNPILELKKDKNYVGEVTKRIYSLLLKEFPHLEELVTKEAEAVLKISPEKLQAEVVRAVTSLSENLISNDGINPNEVVNKGQNVMMKRVEGFKTFQENPANLAAVAAWEAQRTMPQAEEKKAA